MFSWLKSKASEKPRTAAVEPIYHWSEDEIPRYPPFMKGLPAVPPGKLIETQAELIDRIANTAITTPKEFARFYVPAIERFTRYAHLLPASQSHHHRGAGGLLRHSLEVGLWALQSADKVLLDAAKTPSQRREMEPRWQFAVFAAALCHDAGKPVTDVTVANRDRSSVWKPIKEDLYDWAKTNKVDAYFLDWRDGRARQHTALSNLIADRIIGTEALEWIEEGGTELIVWLLESLNCNPGPTNLIHDLVIKADQTSVERDLKTLGVAMAGYDLGVPVERHLTDIMRRFVREGVWLVNEPGARLWNIGGHLYLVWPAAGEELAKQVREDGIPGIPRTPDGILDMLVERQIAFVREGAEPGDRLWKIVPTILAEKIPGIKLTAIRLRDEAMVSSAPIPTVDGKVVDAAAPDASGDSADMGSPSAETSSTAVTHVAQPAQIPPRDSQTPQPEAGEATAPMPAQSKPVPQNQARSKPSISKPAVSDGPASGAQGKGAHEVRLDGAIGEALKALAQDLKSGDKRWGVDATIDAGQYVLLRWPEAFGGYGLTTKSILDELASREWLWIDPMAPLKKVTEANFGDGTAKAIRLTSEISQIMIREAGTAQSNGRIETEVAQSPHQERKPIESEAAPSQAQTKRTKSRKGQRKETGASHARASIAGETRANPPDKRPDETLTNVNTEKTGNGESAGMTEPNVMPTVDDVIAAIKDHPVTVQPDGYIMVSKQDLFAACKKHGLRITHRLLWELANKDPDRLSTDGGTVRIKI